MTPMDMLEAITGELQTGTARCLEPQRETATGSSTG
jgi:hypothetical protein